MPPTDPTPSTAIEVDQTRLEVFDDLIAGSRDAVELVYQRFLPGLLREAEKRIPDGLREKILAESVLHSVMDSLLDLNEKRREGWKKYRITNWAGLYGLLATIVARKTLNRIRGLRTQKKDARREVGLDAADALAGGPDPEALADYNELVTQLFERLDADERRVLMLRMDGKSDDEIAAELGWTRTVIAEMFRKVKRWLQRKIDEQADG